MEPSTIAGVVGAIVLALIGWLGKSAATILRDRAKRREQLSAAELDISRTREARPWQLMETRIDDLEAERERLAGLVERQSALIDRIRQERDTARLDSTDWEIAARKANGAIARVTELQQQCDDEREQHRKIVERLSAEIRKLRGDH